MCVCVPSCLHNLHGVARPQLFPFGFGLSYQHYAYTSITPAATAGATAAAPASTSTSVSVSAAALGRQLAAPGARRTTRLSAPSVATVSVVVKRLDGGHTRAAAHSVLLFASPPGAGAGGLPLKTLAGFQRVPTTLTSSSCTLVFNLTAFDLSVVGTDGKREVVEGDWKVVAGLPDSPEAGPSATATITVA